MIRFELGHISPSINEFIVEVSINNKQSWLPATHQGPFYSANSFNSISSPEDEGGGKRIYFRARSYVGPGNTSRSYGYLEKWIDVYPKPTCQINDTLNYCSTSTGVSSFKIDSINSKGFELDAVVVKLEKFDPQDSRWKLEEWSKTIPKNQLPKTLIYGDRDGERSGDRRLDEGLYRIVLENQFVVNGNTYQSGHSYWPFVVEQREALSNFIKQPSIMDCQTGTDIFNFKNKDMPSYIAGKYTVHKTNGSETTEFTYTWDGNVVVTGFDDTVTIEIWDTQINNCSFNITYHNLFERQKISFTPNVSQPTCSYSNAVITLTNISPENNLEYRVYQGIPTGVFKQIAYPWEYEGESFGNFTVQVKYNQNPECSVTSIVNINKKPDEIAFEADVQDVLGCDNAENGSITVLKIKKAIAPITLTLWKGFSIIEEKDFPSYDNDTKYAFENLTKGDYKIVLRDNNGCEKSIERTINVPVDPFNVNYNSINPCNNPDNNGSITLTAQGGGVSTYHFKKEHGTWSDITNSITYNDLIAGNHTFYVLANNDPNCIITVVANLENQTSFSITENVLHPTCSQAKGSIILSVANSYEYKDGNSWVPYENNGGEQFDPGVHLFRGQIGTCYSLELAVTINSIPEIGITNTSITQPTCNGEFGSYQFNVSGETESDYFLKLDGNTLTNVVSDSAYYSVSNGTYTIHNLWGRGESYFMEVTYGAFCSATTSFIITDPPAISISYEVEEQIKCYGGESKVLLKAEEGTSPYTFNISGNFYINVSDSVLVNLTSGNHTFNVEDSIGCKSSTVEFQITQPDTFVFSIPSFVNPTCSGYNDGEIVVTVNGGVVPYIVYFGTDPNTLDSLENTQPYSTIASLYSGNYLLYAKDKNGCLSPTIVDYLTQTLSAPNPMSISIDSIAIPTCHNFSDGSITLTLSGRVGEEKIVELIQGETILDSYSDVSDTYTFSGLSAGSYTIKFIEESRVCYATMDVTINQPLELTYSLNPTNATCFDSNTGEVEVSVTGGNTPYTITLLDMENGGTLIEIQNVESTSFVFKNLQASVYGITLDDTHGCPVNHPTDSLATIHNPPSALALQLAQQPSDCFATETGQITAEASGGWGSYSFSLDESTWFEAESNYLFTSLGAFSHTIYLRDAMGCEVEQSIEVEQPLELTIDSIIVEPVSCHGGSDGTIEVFASGGNGGYEYNFDGDFVSYSKQYDLISDDYNITVRDLKGCEASQLVFVPQPQPFDLNVSMNIYPGGNNIPCYGLTDMVWLTPNGATTPYSIYINNNPIGFADEGEVITVESLFAGLYSVKVVDANGCEYNYDFTLEQPQPLSFDQITATQPKCHNGSDGSINIKFFSGGSGIYNFELLHNDEVIQAANGVTSFKFEDLASGEYKLIASDTNGCSVDSTIYLGQPLPLVIRELTSYSLMCKGDDSGSISALVGGGVGLYQYQWYNASFDLISTVNPLEGQPAGLYYLRVTDSNGCQATNPDTGNINFTKSIDEPAEQLIISSYIAQQTTCHGQSDGSISVTSSGGWDSNHTYSLNGGTFNINSQFSNLPGEIHEVRVRDGMGCIFTENITVEQPLELTLGFETVVDVDCHGNSTGEVTLSALGGNSGYSYGFSQTALNPSPTFSNLIAGSYTFWVVDSKGCATSTTTQISQPEPLEFTAINIQHPQCGGSDGSFEVLPLGGNTPFTIEWTSHSLPNSLQVSNVEADFYHFTLTDSKGCSNNFSFELNTTNSPTINSINLTEPTCHYRSDGVIEVFIEDFANLESIILSNNDGQTWEGETRIENLPTNLYYVRAMDTDGCIALSSLQLNAPQPIVANLAASPVKCLGDESGSATMELIGGTHPYNVEWFNHLHSMIATGLEAQNLGVGTYYASITDANGCGLTSDTETTTPNFNIDEPQEPLVLSVEQVNSPICTGGTNGQITLAATGGWGGYLYGVNASSPSLYPQLLNLSAGDHEVSVIDIQGCKVTQMVTIADPLPVMVEVNQAHHVKCSGGSDGSIWVSAVNGLSPYRYSINNGNSWNNHGIFNNLTQGEYTILAMDLNECIGTIQMSITQPQPFLVSVASMSPTYCGANNGNINLEVVGGVEPYSIQWEHLAEPSGLTIGSLSSGIYNAHLTDANSCTTQIAVEVPEVDGPMITSYSYTPPLCHDSSDGQLMVDFTGVSSPFYFYLNGQQVESLVVEGIAKGNHQFIVMDEFGCTDTLNFTIDAPQPITIAFDNIVHPLCFDYSNGSLEVLAMGGTPPYSFEWSHGTTSNWLEHLSAGSYNVLVTDSHGCTEESTVNINNPTPIETDLPEVVALCQGQSITLDAQNPSCMHWWVSANGFESFQQVVTIWEAGEYFLQVTNEVGCFTNDTVRVSQYDYEVNSTLLVPSTASVGDTIVIIDISWPIPDNIEWVIPSEFTILVDNPYDKQLIPNAEGVFPMVLVSTTGECTAYMEKSITVSGFNQPVLPKGEVNSSIILSVVLAPNPAKRHTMVEVELLEKADVTIELINSFGQKAKWFSLGGANSYTHQLPLSDMAPGIYLVRVTANGDQRAVRLIVL